MRRARDSFLTIHFTRRFFSTRVFEHVDQKLMHGPKKTDLIFADQNPHVEYDALLAGGVC